MHCQLNIWIPVIVDNEIKPRPFPTLSTASWSRMAVRHRDILRWTSWGGLPSSLVDSWCLTHDATSGSLLRHWLDAFFTSSAGAFFHLFVKLPWCCKGVWAPTPLPLCSLALLLPCSLAPLPPCPLAPLLPFSLLIYLIYLIYFDIF